MESVRRRRSRVTSRSRSESKIKSFQAEQDEFDKYYPRETLDPRKGVEAEQAQAGGEDADDDEGSEDDEEGEMEEA